MSRDQQSNGAGGPRVSVLMPVYNREEYVAAAVESILGQTYGDFEFIIVNDGSTDGATELLREYAARDERIVLIEQENTGYTVALNRGLGVARGEFVARMDSDDIALPERLAIQVRYLEEHDDVVAVSGQGIEIDEEGDPIRPLPKLETHEEIEATLIGWSSDQRVGMLHPGVLMRRAAAERVGGYRPEYEPAEDRDMWLRMAEIGRLANVPETVVQYRVHAGGVSRQRAEKQHAAALRGIEAAHARRGLPVPERIELWTLESRMGNELSGYGVRAVSAARSGYYRTSWKYVLRLLRRRPLDGRGWKAATMCVLGSSLSARLGWLRRAVVNRQQSRSKLAAR